MIARNIVSIFFLALLAFVITPAANAQAPATPPLFATTKVEGTENVYIFRY